MQNEVSSKQFSEWMAFERIEPPMETKMELYLARIAYILALAHSEKGKKPKFEDFLFEFDKKYREPKKMSVKGLKEAFKTWANKYNKQKEEKKQEKQKIEKKKKPRPIRKRQ